MVSLPSLMSTVQISQPSDMCNVLHRFCKQQNFYFCGKLFPVCFNNVSSLKLLVVVKLRFSSFQVG